ncbi:phage scaffolding protein [Staphylococcus americanisciuri]|uniref:Phage scaffolding protein n=1 Tax=Staphylococcus americanisciuri TaxID=2973940 RepID=A0ABT2F449_9STAP|nr:phage scaffolding protein [Staphylococcus americanisciuri]MCS4487199.1 phage scaffolding protein [Staphylococcus americanisciuri]
MKREFLRGLGLEEDTVQKIVDEHHDTLRQFKDKAQKADLLQEQLDKANQELENRDKQITDLQKAKDGDNQELKDKLEQYKQENSQYQADMKELKLNNAIKLAVAKDANDANDVLLMLDKSTLELQEDGTVKGLEDAVKALQETKPYLFANNQPNGRTPNDGESLKGKANITKEDFKNMSYTEHVALLNSNPEKYRELTK